jgi:lactate permease
VDSRVEVARAYAPYLVIIAIFSIFQIDGVKKEMLKEPWTYLFQWPGLDLVTASGKPPSDFTFNWFAAAGTLTIIAGRSRCRSSASSPPMPAGRT